MNEQLGPPGAKYWHEMSADEKIEKLADSLRYLSKQYLETAKLVWKLERHQHGELGMPVIPLIAEDKHEPWILQNPLNQESK